MRASKNLKIFIPTLVIKLLNFPHYPVVRINKISTQKKLERYKHLAYLRSLERGKLIACLYVHMLCSVVKVLPTQKDVSAYAYLSLWFKTFPNLIGITFFLPCPHFATISQTHKSGLVVQSVMDKGQYACFCILSFVQK